MTTTKLKLGPLPKRDLVKITIAVSAELKSRLDKYVQIHAEATGETSDLDRLLPYMLETFIDSDRAFASAERTIR